MNPDIGVFVFEPAGILKRTNPLTVSAGQATILFNYNDFHSSSCIYNYTPHYITRPSPVKKEVGAY